MKLSAFCVRETRSSRVGSTIFGEDVELEEEEEEEEEDWNEELVKAARDDDSYRTKLALKNGADPNSRDRKNSSAPIVQTAVEEGYGDVVKALADAGANLEIGIGREKTSLLHLAVDNEDKETCEILTRTGLTVETIDQDGMTPLHLAARNGRKRAVKFLVDSFGAEIDARDRGGDTPLHLAAQEHEHECANELLKRGARVDAKNSHGETPLVLCICNVDRNGRTTAVLLDAGASTEQAVDRGELAGMTPLHIAAMYDEAYAAKEILRREPSRVSAINKLNGETPLHVAAREDSRKVVELLVKNGADPGARDSRGRIPLDVATGESAIFLGIEAASRSDGTVLPSESSEKDEIDWNEALIDAVWRGQVVLAEEALDNGADPNQRKSGKTLLETAIADGNAKIVGALLEKGARTKYSNRQPALHFAVEIGDRKVVRALVTGGADPDERWCGDAPVHVAVKEASFGALEELANAQADVDAVDVDGKTLVELAVDCLDPKTALDLVLGVGADPYKPTSKNQSCRVPCGCSAVTESMSDDSSAELVEILVSHSKDSEFVDACGNTLLARAVFKEFLKTVKKLLELGADPNAVNKDGVSPLHSAVKNGETDIILALLEAGADPKARDSKGQTPLDLNPNAETVEIINLWSAGKDDFALPNESSTKNNDEVIFYRRPVNSLMLKNGYYVMRSFSEFLLAEADHEKTKFNQRALKEKLFAAVKDCDIEKARKALSVGADPNAKDENGRTPLHYAVEYDNEDCVELLLKSGADLNAKNNDGQTPLHFAAWQNSETCVKLLLKSGADLNARNNNGQTPLHFVVLRGHALLVRTLLENGADPNVQDEEKKTPLHVAAIHNRGTCLEDLLKNGADPNTKDENEETPLHTATQNGLTFCVKILLKNGADPNTKERSGSTALHIAALQRFVTCFEILLDNGSDPNARDNNGRTPLHYIVRYDGSWLSSVKKALKKGADPIAKRADGKTPFDLATTEQIKKTLKDAARAKMSTDILPNETVLNTEFVPSRSKM